jgi:N6-L-threonylcarbamoyladenine synthase
MGIGRPNYQLPIANYPSQAFPASIIRAAMPTRILAIETSCDETAAAVIEDGRMIRANVVASQIDLHQQYGGVFPEMASRAHIEAIAPTIDQAMDDAGADWESLTAVAVTKGPGLPGSLVVGVNAAKGICLARDLPLIGVNHLEGHIYSHWLETSDTRRQMPDGESLSRSASFVQGLLQSASPFPLLVLIVSGGHTELVLMRDHGAYELLGHTVDDAVGEAFDKVARLLNLGYPGGPAIQKAALQGNPQRFKFSRPRVSLNAKTARATNDEFMFSFSGAKTNALYLVRDNGGSPDGKLTPYTPVADIAASFQDSVTDWLVDKCARAAEAYKTKAVLVGGGVSANKLLREKMMARFGVAVSFPPLFLCTDNAAMIGAAAHHAFERGMRDDLTMDVTPDLKLGGSG